MKIRTNFVSNSSSASFVVAKSALNLYQFQKLKEWTANNGWSCYETAHQVNGFTIMDNGDICDFLNSIGVKDFYLGE